MTIVLPELVSKMVLTMILKALNLDGRKEIALGAAIYPISVANGLLYEDPNTSNWWMQYGEKINVGYWPHNLFSLIISGAKSVEWGGEVYSLKLGQSPHTATEMGNGEYPDPIFGDSSYMKRMRVLDNSRILKFS
ncbi:hypothetical protein Pint_27674 [Pistacia integerrima]|uniref:Uncharacterized protein n=1 Tax=Pistacia integerrima TaxID=434235 RepID=A0ACC0YNF2_9ROSI|nr:hypothetical protein Pint_27674 [Pistacia integerrima]